MHSQAIYRPEKPRRLIEDRRLELVRKFALMVWSATMLLNGTFIRPRASESFVVADWLVITRVIIGAMGIILGVYLISKRPLRLGTGSKLVITYVLMALASSLFSDHIRQSMGYWVLLGGAGLLTVGLVSQFRSIAELSRIETLYFVVLSFCVLKDAALSLFAPELRSALIEISEPARLGAGIVPSNRLSIMAAIACWVSLKFHGAGPKVLLLWALRFILVMVVVMTRSRVSLITLVVGGMVWFWLKHRASHIKGVAARFGLIFFLFSALFTLLLLLSCEFKPLMSLLDVINRGEDLSKTMSLTGRTDVWALVLRKITSDPLTAIVGDGYGTSALVLRDLAGSLYFTPRHTHNTFFEFLLTMGLPGVILCISIFVYGFKWLRVFGESHEGDTRYLLARNGVIIFTMILLNCMTEVYIAGKVNFILMALLMYLALLGQTDVIKQHKSVTDTPVE